MRPSRQASYTSSSLRACLDVYLLDTAHIARLCPHFFFVLQGFVVALLDADEDAGWEFLAPFFAFFLFFNVFFVGEQGGGAARRTWGRGLGVP